MRGVNVVSDLGELKGKLRCLHRSLGAVRIMKTGRYNALEM
jgi:hypothetical protein